MSLRNWFRLEAAFPRHPQIAPGGYAARVTAVSIMVALMEFGRRDPVGTLPPGACTAKWLAGVLGAPPRMMAEGLRSLKAEKWCVVTDDGGLFVEGWGNHLADPTGRERKARHDVKKRGRRSSGQLPLDVTEENGDDRSDPDDDAAEQSTGRDGTGRHASGRDETGGQRRRQRRVRDADEIARTDPVVAAIVEEWPDAAPRQTGWADWIADQRRMCPDLDLVETVRWAAKVARDKDKSYTKIKAYLGTWFNSDQDRVARGEPVRAPARRTARPPSTARGRPPVEARRGCGRPDCTATFALGDDEALARHEGDHRRRDEEAHGAAAKVVATMGRRAVKRLPPGDDGETT